MVIRINSRNWHILEMQKDGVITDVYPLKGNEGALGVNLFQSDANAPLLEKIKRSGETVLHGPIKLFQLEENGLVARMPVHLEHKDHPATFWGFVTAIIRFEKFIEITGLTNLPRKGYHYELRRGETFTSENEIIARSFEFPLDNTMTKAIPVPGGDWILQVYPISGWHDSNLLLLCGFVTLVFSGLATA